LPAAALVFIVFFFWHGPLLELLYEPGFRASNVAAALFFAGSLLRIASWIALFGLYAKRRTAAIAAGEILSLPLFAALMVSAQERLTLEMAGAFWLLSYAAYCSFNFWALRRP
jgi:O-antigen/teichoic acid export membrane protein